MNRHITILILLTTTILSCSKSGNTGTSPVVLPIGPIDTTFAKGADISWITEMESKSVMFYDRSGNQKEGMALLQTLGMNAIRLRAWVNPSNGFCNKADVIAKSSRAKALGMKVMIDFHYSDTWADPGAQTKPTAWINQDITTLQSSVYNYTSDVLSGLKAAGVTPSWVQVGNETNNGMLWPEGMASGNMGSFSKLVNSGYKAVKDIFPACKVIVHLSNGFDNSLFRWMFDGLTSYNTNYDIIGMSLYPSATNYITLDNQCLSNMNDMISRYNKDIMITEVGMPMSDSSACNLFLKDIISKTKSLPSNRGLGVFYWEPEAYKSWQGYKLGAFDDNGRPTIALDAFK